MSPNPPYPPAPTRRSVAARRRPTPLAAPLVLLLLGTAALTGCGRPPELREPVAAGPSAPVTAAPAPTGPPVPPPGPPVTPPPLPTTPAVDETVAGACPDGPSGARVVSLVRDSARVVSSGVRIRVESGPFCAGRWHYSVLAVTGHEELQVVTRSDTGRLALVTAGTDVCTIEVRTAGPTGIRAIACDGAPLPVTPGGPRGTGPPRPGVPGTGLPQQGIPGV